MGNLFSFVRRRSTVSQNDFFKIFLSIALTNALSHSVLVKELNSSPVGINYFSYRGTFWPFPLVTSVGFNFVSAGDEVSHQEKFIFLQKGGSFSGQNRAVGKCKGFVAQWSTLLIPSRPMVAKCNSRPSGTCNFSPNGQEVKKFIWQGVAFWGAYLRIDERPFSSKASEKYFSVLVDFGPSEIRNK